MRSGGEGGSELRSAEPHDISSRAHPVKFFLNFTVKDLRPHAISQHAISTHATPHRSTLKWSDGRSVDPSIPSRSRMQMLKVEEVTRVQAYGDNLLHINIYCFLL